MELGSLTGAECVEHLRATQRAHNAAGAARLAAVLEVGLCGPNSCDTVARMPAPDKYSRDELRPALGLSTAAAGQVMDLAWVVCRRLPELHAAMAAGELDETRAWAIGHWTEQLSDEHAHLICADVLPHCFLSAENQWTAGKLIAAVKKLAIALDPDWAERTYAEAVRKRRVVAWRNPDGSADLAGQQLGVDEVAAAVGRVKGLAARIKAAGDPRPIDTVRADLFLGLLDGRWETLTADQIVADYVSTLPVVKPTAPEPGPEPAPGTGPEKRPETERSPLAGDPEWAIQAAAAASARQSPRIGVQLSIRLSTLLGRDRLPAELAGWGPFDATHARRLAQGLSHGQWRWACTDDQGRVEHSGLCYRRPDQWRPRKGWSKGVLDIVFHRDDLDDALEDPTTPPAWRPVLIALAHDLRRAADLRAASWERWQDERDDAAWAGHTPPERARQDAARRARQDAARRFPRVPLRRHLQLKYRTCAGIGCTRPAYAAQIDHNRDHARGGLTTENNLCPFCGRDHDLKTRGGWRLDRLDDYRFRWTTRLGQTRIVTVEPVLPRLPRPGPKPQRFYESPPGPEHDSWTPRPSDRPPLGLPF
jgi:hypothetical protein